MHTAMLRQEARIRLTLVWFETTLEKLGLHRRAATGPLRLTPESNFG
jgi:hypothetical protein